MTKECRIKPGWHQEGREGTLFVVISINGQDWAVVLWKDEEDPDLFKAAGLEVAEVKFVSLEKKAL